MPTKKSKHIKQSVYIGTKLLPDQDEVGNYFWWCPNCKSAKLYPRKSVCPVCNIHVNWSKDPTSFCSDH